VESEHKRTENERKFQSWENLSGGGRRYFYEVQGRYGWKARYIKEVDALEQTLRFWQEIYDEAGHLAEIHEKFPIDKGHRKHRKVNNEGHSQRSS